MWITYFHSLDLDGGVLGFLCVLFITFGIGFIIIICRARERDYNFFIMIVAGRHSFPFIPGGEGGIPSVRPSRLRGWCCCCCCCCRVRWRVGELSFFRSFLLRFMLSLSVSLILSLILSRSVCLRGSDLCSLQ